MRLDKQKKQLIALCGLLLVLAFTMYRWLFSTASPGNAVQTPSSGMTAQLPLDLKDIYLKRNPRRTGGKKETSFRDIDPSIHLDKLTSFDPGEPLNARNMFSIGAPPPERSIGSKTPGAGSSGSGGAGSGGNPNPSPAPVRPAGPPPVVIALKFYGTKTDLAKQRRQGFFAEGDEIYVAAEGDLVANRYRVVRIGDSSAEIEEVSSKMRRQISLQ
jgi:hypothetical protein